MPKPPAQLPQGNAGIWQGISENFSFHASPESFVTSRVLEYQRRNPGVVDARTPIRAKILNRNIAVISSYDQINQVLQNSGDDSSSRPDYVASTAYKDLMNSFFPPPNLLLSDGETHRATRPAWEARVEPLPNKLSSFAKKAVQRHFEYFGHGIEFDLYESMKSLSWELLLGAFLDLDPEQPEFETFQSLHEDLLRGQFSLLPVRINLGFWHSPRKVGVDARRKLQDLIAERLKSSEECCPFAMPDEEARKDIADHSLLFTSSLAVKALASLLTAFLLNLYVYRGGEESSSLAASIQRSEDASARIAKLENVLSETERLSPPIVGVMRRCAREKLISSPSDQADVVLPAGWDVWLYFVGAGRDPSEFGETFDTFDPNRYLDREMGPSLAFGAGPKICLGQGVARRFVLAVAETLMDMDLSLKSTGLSRGVRGWLGWESQVSPEDWAADMKQLPTQRPAGPVIVTLASET